VDKKYIKYSVEDFTPDLNFINWVNRGIDQKDWENLVRKNPNLSKDIDAAKKIVDSGVPTNDITVDLLNQNLYYPEIPPLDLIVRTSGEKRISNFMLWRSAYSEIMFIDKLWPDLTKDDVTEIIDQYSLRARRFGG